MMRKVISSRKFAKVNLGKWELKKVKSSKIPLPIPTRVLTNMATGLRVLQKVVMVLVGEKLVSSTITNNYFLAIYFYFTHDALFMLRNRGISPS